MQFFLFLSLSLSLSINVDVGVCFAKPTKVTSQRTTGSEREARKEEEKVLPVVISSRPRFTCKSDDGFLIDSFGANRIDERTNVRRCSNKAAQLVCFAREMGRRFDTVRECKSNMRWQANSISEAKGEERERVTREKGD
jgi:hypothetical protein